MGILCSLLSAALIFDTDIGSSTDDLVGLELCARLHQSGKVELKAVMVSRPGEEYVRLTDAVLHYYKLDGIPTGTVPDDGVSHLVFSPYAKLLTEFHELTPSGLYPSNTMNAVALYRTILAGSPDHSIDVVAVGFFTNLMGLLDADRELVARKVRSLRIMAGSFNGVLMHPEYNVWGDVKSAKRIFEDWPTPIVVSPYEVGLKVYYPREDVKADYEVVRDIKNPIYLTYCHWDPDNGCPKAQLMWDPMTVLSIVFEGQTDNPFTYSEPGEVIVNEDGADNLKNGLTTFREEKDGRVRIQQLSVENGLRVRRYLRDFTSHGRAKASISECSNLRIHSVKMSDPQFLVLTNTSNTAGIQLAGVRIVCVQPEKKPLLDYTFGADAGTIPPLGSFCICNLREKGLGEIPKMPTNIVLFSPSEDVLQEAFVDPRWFGGAANKMDKFVRAKQFISIVIVEDQWETMTDSPFDEGKSQ